MLSSARYHSHPLCSSRSKHDSLSCYQSHRRRSCAGVWSPVPTSNLLDALNSGCETYRFPTPLPRWIVLNLIVILKPHDDQGAILFPVLRPTTFGRCFNHSRFGWRLTDLSVLKPWQTLLLASITAESCASTAAPGVELWYAFRLLCGAGQRVCRWRKGILASPNALLRTAKHSSCTETCLFQLRPLCRWSS